jgi:hypothetical protein
MSYINKLLCTLKGADNGNQSPVPGNSMTRFGLQIMLLFCSLQLATAQEIVMGSALIQSATDCVPPVVVAVSTAQETACGNKDGKISIQVQDEDQDATYTVILTQEKKQMQYNSLSASNGMVKISNVVPAGFTGLQIVREQDDCASNLFTEPFLIQHACATADMRSTVCGGGSFTHQNCEGIEIFIDGDNISPDTYIFLDVDYNTGCIGFVNSNCEIVDDGTVFCADHQLVAPTPNSGYDYGDVIFTKETGLVANLGISELKAERINWVMLNGPPLGYTNTEINQAIWHFSSNRDNCNGLCQGAKNAVTSVQGGIDQYLEVYMPNIDFIQPFIANTYSCISSIDGLFINDDDGDSNVLEITDGAQLDLNTLPDNFRLEANVSGTVGSVKFTISGDDNNVNIEGSFPYNAPGGSEL